MINKLKKIIVFVFLMTTIFVVGDFVLAQSADVTLWGGTQNEINSTIGLGNEDPRIMAANIIRVALGFLGIVALVIIIYAGWLWMTAGGNFEQIDKAKKVLSGAVIGLVIILSSFAVTSFVLDRFLASTFPSSGVSCTPFALQACGCGGAGSQTCNAAGNAWSACTVAPCVVASSLVVTAKQPPPAPAIVPMNSVIRFAFNQSVDLASVDASSFTVVDSSATAVAGNRPVINNIVEFIPDAASNNCPAANACGATECFAANETITVKAVAGRITDASGTVLLTCPGVGDCDLTFTVSDTVDCAPPTVNFSSNPLTTQICVDHPFGIPVYLGFTATDDAGVSKVAFDVGGSTLDFVGGVSADVCGGSCGAIAPWFQPLGTIKWFPTSANYSAGTTYSLSATAFDLDTNTAVDSQSFVMREGHCCNGIQDVIFGETGIDCGGPDCAACTGAACAIDAVSLPDTSCSDALCASSYCTPTGSTLASCAAAGYGAGVASCCLCQDAPIVDWITPYGGYCDGDINTYCQSDADCTVFAPNTCNTSTPNGAVGNLVTIGGRSFGAVQGAGLVEFNDYNPNVWVTASLADTLPLTTCTNSWQDKQITVEVPAGITSEPLIEVRVTENNGLWDTTQTTDGRGPIMGFVSNSIIRPGVCTISPTNGAFGSSLTYDGIRLTGSTAYFGDALQNVVALNSNFPGSQTGSADVPNITTGLTTTFVTDSFGVSSNYLNFTKDPEPYTGPYITSFTVTQGTTGQYVTISGGGFGLAEGAQLGNTHNVYFDNNLDGDAKNNLDGDEIKGSFIFPLECADVLWTDHQIIVKVPDIATAFPANDPGDYFISVNMNAISVADSSGLNSSIASTTFRYDSSLPLAPSLCKIDPVMGPAQTTVSLWGEYFGAKTTGRVVFNFNRPSPAPSMSWNSTSPTNIITGAIVKDSVISGPVVVEQGGIAGNGINFRVGNCTVDEDCTICGSIEVCCPPGTYRANECATDINFPIGTVDINDCYAEPSNSAFEWTFSTDFGTPPLSCAGYNLSQCTSGTLCPNSPGECSSYAGGLFTDRGGCASADCVGIGACTTDCQYDNNLNKCKDLTQPLAAPGNCSLDSIENDIFGTPTDTYCGQYNDGTSVYSVWHMDTNANCPATAPSGNPWIRISGNRCIDIPQVPADTCDLCDTGFDCFDNSSGGGTGICIVDVDICPSGSACDITTQRCLVADDAKCECCCDIGSNDPASGINPGCCAPLTCGGNCGSDASGPDTNTFGMCTGCTTDTDGDGTLSAAEHTASDAACNCSGTTGKVCNVTAGGDANLDGLQDGTCVDVAPTGAPCSSLTCPTTDPPCGGTDFCDATASCTCQPIGVGTPCDFNGTSPSCGTNPNDLCTAVPGLTCDADGADGLSGTADDCTCISTGAGVGEKCQINLISPPVLPLTQSPFCTDATLPYCAIDYQCLDDGSGIDCSCCCDPTVLPVQTNSTGLECVDAPGSTCTGPTRGLYCGCSSDSECNNTATTGCGGDTCCRPRPTILATSPVDGDVDVCRNTLITVDFDREMDVGSFSGNVIVVGNYGSNVCPVGTNYLVSASPGDSENMSFLKKLARRISIKIKTFLAKIPFINKFIKKASALTDNFCAVSGSVGGFNRPSGETTLTFSSDKVLDASALYHVIVKGDSDVTDGNSEGVLSIYGVSMDDTWSDLDGNGIAAEIGDRTLNGKAYYGYSFSFTTMSDVGPDNGICKIDHVEVKPSSYLFNDNTDDLNEVDNNFTNSSFDTERDSDKVFEALAVSDSGYTLNPTVAYRWDWTWATNNASVVNFDTVNPYSSTPPVDSKQLFSAQAGKTDGKATLTATATEVAGGSAVHSGDAEAWVFVCENPWPPVNSTTGLWFPWSDNLLCIGDPNIDYCSSGAIVGSACGAGTCSSNCLLGTGNCFNMNYELYYCRDSGGFGTQDDLPSILSSGTIVRGSSTVSNLLKEFYFLRELTASSTSGITSIVNLSNDVNGEVDVAWNAAISSSGYRLYYGTSPGNYTSYVDVGNVVTSLVSNLAIDTKYYFSVTSYDSSTGSESAYSPESSITTTDSIAPQSPININLISACNGAVELEWDANTFDTSGYKVYWGTNPGSYGGSQDINNSTSVQITGLSNIKYYFAVTAYDSAGNESPYSLAYGVTVDSSCNSLVAYWPFDDATGGFTPDIVGGNNGVVNSDVTLVSGGFMGNAMEFNGLGNSYISVGDGNDLKFATGNFSIAFWMKASPSAGNTNIISKVSAANSGYFIGTRSSANNNRFFTQIESSSTILETDSVTGQRAKDDTWHHMAITVDRSGLMTRYFDGVVDGVTTDITSMTGMSLDNTIAFEIGRKSDPPGLYYIGLVDEVRVHNKVLSASEVSSMYNNDIGVSIQSGIVSRWSFDEGSGPTAYDSIGSNDGTLFGGTSWNSNGRVGGAMNFDGVNGYVDVGNDPSLTIGGDMTIGAWVKSPVMTGGQQLVLSNRNPVGYMYFGTTGGRMYTYINTATPLAGVQSSLVMGDDVWNHMLWTSEGGTTRLYINGNPAGVTTQNYTSSLDDTYIGYDISTGDYWTGIIDELIVYNKALSVNEAAALYGGYTASAPVSTYLVSEWKFDEGSGFTAFDNAASGNNGTLNGGVTWDVSGKSGSALSFDGSTGYVDVGIDSSLDMSVYGEMTYSIWIKPSSYPPVGIRAEPLRQEDNFYASYFNGTWSLGIFDGSGNAKAPAVSATFMPINVWTNIVIVANGVNVIAYINGVQQGSVPYDGVLQGMGSATIIGAYKDKASRFFDGSIDEVQIYSKGLTPSEVQLLYLSY